MNTPSRPRIELLVPEWPAPARVRACVTTRGPDARGESPYSGLNLADHVGDDPAVVRANRAALRRHLNLPAEPLWLRQVHGTRVVEAGTAPVPVPEADAAWARTSGVVCVVLTADCLPVLLCDRAGSRVAAVHAGWRGLCAGVLESAVEAVHCPGNELLAWLGPAIGPRRFEVGDEVRDCFVARDVAAAEAFRVGARGRWLADLYALARRRLNLCGVSAVYGGGWCTYEDADRFYSFRRDRQTGRMASLIWLQ